MGGSSPRTRRTLRTLHYNPSTFRFISAHAENTILKGQAVNANAVHLRARGEHVVVIKAILRAYGSSPRTRRTLRKRRTFHRNTRFISAHAENTMDSCGFIIRISVHLRARGEHHLDQFGGRRIIGSSPRTRRTLGGIGAKDAPLRFISAHAENTLTIESVRGNRSVHLRARGEHGDIDGAKELFDGSSPRTRRTPYSWHMVIEDGRFISAHAENTSSERLSFSVLAVHLRARGEHNKFCFGAWRAFGSSPRTRRTQRYYDSSCRKPRFISAHAENTKRFIAHCSPRSVHLRARGEHLNSAVYVLCICGSSPRTRRTPAQSPSSRWSSRFISAHAENT